MLVMRIACGLLAFLIMLVVVCPAALGYADTIQVGSRVVAPGPDYSFPIYAYLHQSHSGFEIPLAFSSYDLVFDSAIMTGTIVPSDYEISWRIEEDSAEMLIFIFPFMPGHLDNFIDPPGGKLCDVYFHVRDFAPDQFVFVDTAAYPLYDELTDTLIMYYTLSGYDTYGTAIDLDFLFGTISIYTDVNQDNGQGGLPEGFRLFQNYPNPFNPATIISYQLPFETDVSFEVINLLGQRISLRELGRMRSGLHCLEFQAHDLESGLYFYRIRAGGFCQVRKMILIR